MIKGKHLIALFKTAILILIIQPVFSQNKSIALHPENPHYFTYQGKPTVLITSGEHYGAVVNLDFDYIKYLDELKSKGLNLTRTFTGAYVEPPGAFNIVNNTLAPVSGRFISPWKRSAVAGYLGGGNKFDLRKWDDAYFARLKRFVGAAQKRGIIVELTFFCPFYDESQWQISPMNNINNINNMGAVTSKDVYTLDMGTALLDIQKSMVQKIVNELKAYKNLIYEICNEPYFGGVTMAWQHHIAGIIMETEKGFKHPHLISQNIANNTLKINNPHPAVSVFNFHYATPPVAVSQNYHLNKVIGDNETGFNGSADETYRMQGWLFILAGGALYNNLDYSFAPNMENGTFVYPEKQPGGGSTALRRQLSYLKNFMARLDFIRMGPDVSFITGALPKETQIQGLSEVGKQYAVYLHSDKKIDMELNLPAGTYKTTWMNTLSGYEQTSKSWIHKGGKITLVTPDYIKDIALRITAAGSIAH
ncbi:MAG: cellulase family glycosylhydrolase [Sphingobacteriaceae bacterium]